MAQRGTDEPFDDLVTAVRAALAASSAGDAAASSVLIALDFDGTLAPLVHDPSASRPLPGTIAVLQALEARGAQVAVVTGREAFTALELGELARVPGIVVVGLYGMQSWHADQLESPAEPSSIAELRAALPDIVSAAGIDGAWVEDKGLSLVVHTRTAADPDAALRAVREPVTALANRLGLEVHDGKFVLELRPPGFDKGGALRGLVERFSPSLVLYAGDDVGDVPALRLASSMGGFAVVAGASDTPAEVVAAASVVVDGPAGVLELLGLLVD